MLAFDRVADIAEAPAQSDGNSDFSSGSIGSNIGRFDRAVHRCVDVGHNDFDVGPGLGHDSDRPVERILNPENQTAIEQLDVGTNANNDNDPINEFANVCINAIEHFYWISSVRHINAYQSNSHCFEM